MNITDPLIGKQLGDYQIVAILGRGGMARVYRGYDARLERYAAVKVIDIQLLNSGDEHEYRRRFRQEARSIANMRHPNIVDVYQFGEFANLYYMAMVFVEGRDLGQILREHAQNKTRMSYGQVMRIARDMANALDYAHSQGVIHRDVKPSNIMVTKDGHGVLTDFGLALSVPEGSMGKTFGSAHYIAPEQALASNNAVPQSDLYSLCVVVYQMLAGKVPFDDPSAMSVVLQHLRDPVPLPSLFNPGLGVEVEQTLLKGLHKDPARRYANGAALIRTLEAALRRQHIDLTYSETPAPLDVRGLPVKPALDIPSGSSPTIPLPLDVQPPGLRAAEDTGLNAITAIPPAPVTDKRATPLPQKQAAGAGRRWTARIGIAGLLLTVIAAAVLLSLSAAGPGSRADASQDAATRAAPALAASLPTATTVLPGSSTRSPDPTWTRAQPSPAPTETVNMPAASDTPRWLSPAPAALPAFIPDVRLIYDLMAFSLINISSQTLDLRDLEFAQRLPDGSERRFRANLWSSAHYSVEALEPSDCLQVWVDAFTSLDPLADCNTRQSWRMVSLPRWFWISDAGDGIFHVERFDVILAACAISSRVCEFKLGD